MGTSLVQYYKNGRGWELIGLEDGEIQEVHDALRERNRQTFSECLKDAEALLSKYQGPHNSSIEALAGVAQHLFERQAIHASVILDAVLRRKAFDLKRERGRTGGERHGE